MSKPDSDKPITVTDSDMRVTLERFSKRNSTPVDVHVKIQELLKQLEEKDQESVLKNLLWSETFAKKDAKKWKLIAIGGVLSSIMLLLCVFAVTMLSVQLSKEVYVAQDNTGAQPAMTSSNGEVLGTANAKQEYSLASAPLLPVHLLKSITEITFQDPWNETVSTEIVERRALSTTVASIKGKPIILKSISGFEVFVAPCGTTWLIGYRSDTNGIDKNRMMHFDQFPDQLKQSMPSQTTNSIAVQICGKLSCARFSGEDPTDQALQAQMKTRKLQMDGSWWWDARMMEEMCREVREGERPCGLW